MNAFSFHCQINMWERWETLKTPPKNVPSTKEHEIDIMKCLFCLCHCGDVPTGLGDAPSGQSAKQTWERCNLISSNHQRHQKVDKGQGQVQAKRNKTPVVGGEAGYQRQDWRLDWRGKNEETHAIQPPNKILKEQVHPKIKKVLVLLTKTKKKNVVTYNKGKI